MKPQPLRIDLTGAPRIVNRVSAGDLRAFYKRHLNAGVVHPAQWFTDAKRWYKIHTFNNPYNIGRPNAELALVLKNKEELREVVRNRRLVFWGIGNSDTEMEIVNLQLQASGGEASVIAIDINRTFLTDFGNALKDKLKEDSAFRIEFLGVRTLFECAAPSDIGAGQNMVAHVCLGNTIGNYTDLADIAGIFRRNMSARDRMLVGFQTDAMEESIARRYIGNRYLESLFRTAPFREYRRLLAGRQVRWFYNKKAHQVEAWVADVQVFRSRKFKPRALSKALSDYGFALFGEWADEFTTCLQAFAFR